MIMSVKELKESITNLPDDTKVMVEVEGDIPCYEEAEEVWYAPLCNTVKIVAYERG